MKNLTIIYFTLFLSFGNILLSSAHELNHRHHCINEHIEVDCSECVILNSLDSYTIIKFVNEFPLVIIIKFQLELVNYFSSEFNLKLKSRAPPTT